MAERIEGARLSEDPVEQAALTKLLEIEGMVARNETDAARPHFDAFMGEFFPEFDKRFEAGELSDIARAIEDRVTTLRLRLYGSDPTEGDETSG